MCSCQEASSLIEKAEVEERRLYISTISTSSENKDKGRKEVEENPPPPPILLSRTNHSLTFTPAPYNLEGQVRFPFDYVVKLLILQLANHPLQLIYCSSFSLYFCVVLYQVCWYQLCSRAAEGINRKVRLGDCGLPGTGDMVQFLSFTEESQV